MAETTDVRTALVELADKVASKSLAGRPGAGEEARYLEGFRVAYRHLNQTVYGDRTVGRERDSIAEADALWPKK
jgi:hypothetical protein